MGTTKRAGKKAQAKKKNKMNVFAAVGIVGAVLIGFIVFIVSLGGAEQAAASGDLKIVKSEVTENAKFYPYKAGRTKMEVVAVKASDGTIRTAFNTCQVCYDSGRGYYKQQGDELVCQNCGNRFKFDQVELIKGGCNPVPILKENKIEDDETITIPQDFLEANKILFGNWRK